MEQLRSDQVVRVAIVKRNCRSNASRRESAPVQHFFYIRQWNHTKPAKERDMALQFSDRVEIALKPCIFDSIDHPVITKHVYSPAGASAEVHGAEPRAKRSQVASAHATPSFGDTTGGVAIGSNRFRSQSMTRPASRPAPRKVNPTAVEVT